ncbi:zinc ribbon domain-containing protein [Haloterrigena salifodinae]|uniref:Zinc ribbon domain-containing protein n=1 Tax=Haloterrigena salifodinae TaxID=2675099 RepID=A0A8T8E226_9EURY|nr:zinc ribbon domain-containing protein [Haloterrigena salifodinae]QRV15572.1 zinc ribbon domain-containing protein [Haloterrigena salifodinae]
MRRTSARSTRLQREIDELVARGWTIEEEAPDHVVMIDREFGSVVSHLLVAILTFWFSMGVGNVVWGAYNYVANSRRRVLWEDGQDCPNCGASASPDAAYCPDCGEELSSGRDSSATVVCPDCEAAVDAGSRYCPNCGTKLADAVGERTDAVDSGASTVDDRTDTFDTGS